MQINHVLILGAGAIGQVIGTHLRLSGCDVTFWVRPTQQAELESKGLTIYNVKTETELHISAPQVLSTLPQDAQYDAVFVCVRSDQLDEALAQLKAQLPSLEEKLIVTLQPGREDGLKTFRALSEAVIVPGAVAFSAYYNEENKRIEYWAPKSMPSLIGPPFNETLHVRDEVVRLLQQGGIPAKGVNDLEAESRFVGVFLNLVMVGLNLSQDSLKNLMQNKKLLQLTAQGIREGIEITRKDLGFIPVKFKPLAHLSAEALSGMLWGIERSALGDFQQKMWATHTPKVKSQTYRNVDDLLNLSLQQSKQPPLALTALAAMTPEKIGEYLKSTRQFTPSTSQQGVKLGLAVGVGSLVLWRLFKRARS